MDVTSFLETKPYGLVREIDAAAGRIVFRGTASKPCPEIWSVLIGECLHNLRSALDYMVWDLVILETGKPPVGDKTQFPIFTAPGRYTDAAKKYLKGVGSRPRALIKACSHLAPPRANVVLFGSYVNCRTGTSTAL